MKLELLQDLYISELRDLYSAEDQIINGLPKLIKKATSPDLQTALKNHLEEARGHVARLERVFQMHAETPKKEKCKGMEGILDEAMEMAGKDAAPAVRDAAIVSGCQRVAHYEIAAYGSVRAYAEQLGHERAAAVLDETLNEERAADRALSEIGKRTDMPDTRTA
jgi:ferritin-like metal-binding protein YciE